MILEVSIFIIGLLVTKNKVSFKFNTPPVLSVTLSELQYDASGYIKLYKANANIKVVYKKGEEKNNFTILDTDDQKKLIRIFDKGKTINIVIVLF